MTYLRATILLIAIAQGCGSGGGGSAPDPRGTSVEPTRLVDPAGSPSSDCQPASPCTTIARAAEVAGAGDVVLIKPGTYTGDVVVHGEGTRDRPIVFTAETPGTVVVDGHIGPGGSYTFGGPNSVNPYVTWRGLTIRNAGDGNGPAAPDCSGGTFAVFPSLGWRIEDSVLERGQSGVWLGGHDVVIDGVTFQDLTRYAFIGSRSNRTVIRDSVVRRINTGGAVDPLCGAVAKILRSDGVVFEGNQSYENVGPGFWLDWDNKNYVVRNNVFRDNRGRDSQWEGAGLWVEGNPDSNGKVYGNTFADNTGPGLGIFESVGVEVRENTFVENAMGILLRNLPRDPDGRRVLRRLSIHDNTFNSWTWSAITTSVGDWTGWSPETHDIVIERNAYASNQERPPLGGLLSSE